MAIVGRPVARHLDDGWTREVDHGCAPTAPNACSKLYGAAWRAAKSLGYIRLITYTVDPTKAAPANARRRPLAADWRARRRRLEPSPAAPRRYPEHLRRPKCLGGRRAAPDKETPGCRLIAAARARPGHADHAC